MLLISVPPRSARTERNVGLTFHTILRSPVRSVQPFDQCYHAALDCCESQWPQTSNCTGSLWDIPWCIWFLKAQLAAACTSSLCVHCQGYSQFDHADVAKLILTLTCTDRVSFWARNVDPIKDLKYSPWAYSFVDYVNLSFCPKCRTIQPPWLWT